MGICIPPVESSTSMKANSAPYSAFHLAALAVAGCLLLFFGFDVAFCGFLLWFSTGPRTAIGLAGYVDVLARMASMCSVHPMVRAHWNPQHPTKLNTTKSQVE